MQCAGDRGFPIKYLRTHATHAENPQEEKGQRIGLLDDLLRVEQQTWQSLSASCCKVAPDLAEVSAPAVLTLAIAAEDIK